MKNISLFLLIMLIGGSQLFAQSPSGFNYQAVIRDGSGDVLANQNVNLRIRILQNSASGTAVHSETFSKTTNAFGLVNVIIGTSGDLSGINWGSDSYFIETAVDISGGTNFTVLGTSQLMSVPYAMYAANSANDGTDGADGASAYQIWLDAGNSGSEVDFLASLEGPAGQDGEGLTPEVQSQIDANTAKVGITPEQASDIETNNEKVGITEEQSSAIEANTAKMGISEEQATAIEANSAKTGITEEQETAIEVNTAKVGITTEQSDAIIVNSEKVGITEEQATAIATNSADPDTDETNEIQDLEVIGDKLRITGNENATQISLGGKHYAGDIKHSFASQSHGGWYLLNGDPVSSLPETAQAAAASIGIIGNLPDARDRFLKGNADGQSSSTTGGSNSITIGQENLELFALNVTESQAGSVPSRTVRTTTNGDHNHNYNVGLLLQNNIADVVTSSIDNVWREVNVNGATSTNGDHTHDITIGAIEAHNHNVQVTSGGSGIPISRPAYLTTNIFIYLGEISLSDLQALGQTNQEIMNTGISPATMVSEGALTLQELVNPANPTEILFNYTNTANMGASEPVTLQVLVDQGFDLSTLYDIYDYDLIAETVVTTLTLFNAGISIAQMADDTNKVGIELSEFVSHSIPIADLDASGLYSLQDIDNHFNASDMLTIASVAELLNEDGSGTDITVQELYSGGAIASDFYGTVYQGGLIFYTESNGLTYVAQSTDQSSGIIWAAAGSGVDTNRNFGSGASNTDNILAYDAGPNAASVCRDLGSEWFLPTEDEIQVLHDNLHANGLGAFSETTFYWTSHDDGNNSNAGYFDFSTGQSNRTERATLLLARAIKSFISAPN